MIPVNKKNAPQNPAILPEWSRTNGVTHAARAFPSGLPRWLLTHLKQGASLTIALSWELLACVMPRMLVVCITSTEKLGSQLAIRDPKTNENPAQVLETSFPMSSPVELATQRYQLVFTEGLPYARPFGPRVSGRLAHLIHIKSLHGSI